MTLCEYLHRELRGQRVPTVDDIRQLHSWTDAAQASRHIRLLAQHGYLAKVELKHLIGERRRVDAWQLTEQGRALAQKLVVGDSNGTD